MLESFKKIFTKEKTPEKIKEEEALKLVEKIRKIKQEMKEKGETIKGYEKIIQLLKEIKTLYEEKERHFKNEYVVCHYEGKWYSWRSHPEEGVVIQKGNDWIIYTGKEE